MQLSTGLETFVVRDVLFETDMPEVVVAAAQGRPWLGVFSDYERSVNRWIYAPATSLEIRALQAGAADLHECFRKPEVFVVDESTPGIATRAYQVDGRELDESVLPRLSLTLPALVGPATPASHPEISFAHDNNRPGLLIRPLGNVMDMLQRLYYALAQALFDGKTTASAPISAHIRSLINLEVHAAAPGSLRLQIKPPEVEAFARVNAQLDELMRASDVDDAHALFETLGARVYGRYGELLELLEDHSLHMLITGPGARPVFMASHIATRRLNSLPAQARMDDPPYLCKGVFLGFDSSVGTFTFYDIHSDTEIRGRLAKNFVPPTLVSVGAQSPVTTVTIRRVRIATRRGHEIDRYELVEMDTHSMPEAL